MSTLSGYEVPWPRRPSLPKPRRQEYGESDDEDGQYTPFQKDWDKPEFVQSTKI